MTAVERPPLIPIQEVSDEETMQFNIEHFFKIIEARFGRFASTILLAAIYLAIFGTALALINDHIVTPLIGYLGKVSPFIGRYHLDFSWFTGLVSALLALVTTFLTSRLSAEAERLRTQTLQKLASLTEELRKRQTEMERARDDTRVVSQRLERQLQARDATIQELRTTVQQKDDAIQNLQDTIQKLQQDGETRERIRKARDYGNAFLRAGNLLADDVTSAKDIEVTHHTLRVEA